MMLAFLLHAAAALLLLCPTGGPKHNFCAAHDKIATCRLSCDACLVPQGPCNDINWNNGSYPANADTGENNCPGPDHGSAYFAGAAAALKRNVYHALCCTSTYLSSNSACATRADVDSGNAWAASVKDTCMKSCGHCPLVDDFGACETCAAGQAQASATDVALRCALCTIGTYADVTGAQHYCCCCCCCSSAWCSR